MQSRIIFQYFEYVLVINYYDYQFEQKQKKCHIDIDESTNHVSILIHENALSQVKITDFILNEIVYQKIGWYGGKMQMMEL